MRRFLRWLSLAVMLGSVIFWLAAGANRGFTKTTVPVRKLDEVLGIEGITNEKRFVPGIDFLGGAAIGAGLLAAFSFLFHNKPKTEHRT